MPVVSRGRSPRTSRRDTDGWVSSLALGRSKGRDHVLLLAEPPLQQVASEVARANQLTPLACRTPLEAIQLLERHGGDIAYAILSSEAHGGLEMRRFLADEYPEIKRILLVG